MPRNELVPPADNLSYPNAERSRLMAGETRIKRSVFAPDNTVIIHSDPVPFTDYRAVPLGYFQPAKPCRRFRGRECDHRHAAEFSVHLRHI